MTLWEELLGSTVKSAALIVSRARLSTDSNVSAEVNTEWSYQELEAVLVDGFVHKGLLHKHESGYVDVSTYIVSCLFSSVICHSLIDVFDLCSIFCFSQHGYAEELQQRVSSRRPSLQSIDSAHSGAKSSPSASPFNPAGRKQVSAAHDSPHAPDSAGIAMSGASYSTKGYQEEVSEQDDAASPHNAHSNKGADAQHSPQKPNSSSHSPVGQSSGSTASGAGSAVGQAWSPSRRVKDGSAVESQEPSRALVANDAAEASLKSVRPSSSAFSNRTTVAGATGPVSSQSPTRADATPSPPLFLEEPEGSDEEPFRLEETEEADDVEESPDDRGQDARTEASLSFNLSSPGSSTKTGSYKDLSPKRSVGAIQALQRDTSPSPSVSPKALTPQFSPKSTGSPIMHANSSINSVCAGSSPKSAHPTFVPPTVASPKVSALASLPNSTTSKPRSPVSSPSATGSATSSTSPVERNSSPKAGTSSGAKAETEMTVKSENQSVQVQPVSPPSLNSASLTQTKESKISSPKPWSILQSMFASSPKSPDTTKAASASASTSSTAATQPPAVAQAIATDVTSHTPVKSNNAVNDAAFKDALNSSLLGRVVTLPTPPQVAEITSPGNKKWPVVATVVPAGSAYASPLPPRRDFTATISPHSFGTTPSRSPPTSARARSPQATTSRTLSPPHPQAPHSSADQGRLSEEDLRFAIDLSADDAHTDHPPAGARPQDQAATLAATQIGATSEARMYVISGITRRKFTADEFALLQKLPHCRADAQLQHQERESSAESKTNSFYALPKKPDNALKATPSSVLKGTLIAAGTCLDKSCANLDDAGLIKALNECSSGSTISAAILRGNKCVKLTSLRLSERFTHLIALDLSHNRLSGRIAVNILPPTLVRLDLSHNALTDFSGVMSCMRLEELNLSHNQIETIHVLPKTLVRLNIEHNFIWSKMCLRLLALSPELRFVGMDGNPVLELVSGWSVFLRSISAKLEYVGKHQTKHSPKKSAIHAHSDRSLYLSTRSTALHMPPPVALTPFNASGMSDAEQKRSLAEQRQRDQDRSDLHHTRLYENAQLRERQLESTRLAANLTVGGPKPEHEILSNTMHLTQPKYQSAKHPNSAKKKKGSTQPPSFGTGRSSYGSFLPTQVWETGQNTSNNDTKPDIQSEPIPKWSRGASLAALNSWIELASTGLEGAVVLIAQVDQELVRVPRRVTTDDVEIYQEHLQDLRLQECDPLPLKVKMALNAVVFESSIIDIVTQLHRRLKDYRTILRQLETAMILSARDGGDFRSPFTIILGSPLGESLRKPATKSTLLSATKRTLSEPDLKNAPPLPANDQNAALRERLSRTITTSSSAANAASTYTRPTDQFAEALTEKSMAPWLTLAAHNQAHSASVLAGLMELSTHLSHSTGDEKYRSEVLSTALIQLRKDLVELNLAQYGALPEPVKVALSVQSRHTREVQDNLRILQAFAKLFREVENVLQLCATGGVDFEAALQGVMNSSYGRTVKRLVQGAPAMTIVVPRSRTSTPTQSPKEKSPKLGWKKSFSPSQSQSQFQSQSPAQSLSFQHFFEEPSKPEVPEKSVVAPSSLSFAGRFYASVDVSALPAVTAPTVAQPVPATSIVDDAKSTVDVKDESTPAVDANPMSVQEWIEKSEEALGSAAIVFNMLIDVAHSNAPLSDNDVHHLQDERNRLNLISLEPPPMEVIAALHLLDKHDPILRKVHPLRTKLDEFDDLFARVENAMLMAVEDNHDFRYSFDVIMRTELGQRINREVYSIYDYRIHE